jgi:hypothetical protein
VVFWFSLDSGHSPTSELGRYSWLIHSAVRCGLSLEYSGMAGGPKSVSTGGWTPQKGALERERRPMILVSLDSSSTSRLHPLPISKTDLLPGELLGSLTVSLVAKLELAVSALEIRIESWIWHIYSN